jgi:hypothetical protein
VTPEPHVWTIADGAWLPMSAAKSARSSAAGLKWPSAVMLSV